MPDNVNITVNKTIENVVINPSISTDVIDINTTSTTETVNISVTPELTTVNINQSISPTNTSDLTNDGEDGTNPFITALDIPASNSYGLYAQTAESNFVYHSSGETSIVGAGVGTLSVPADTFKVGDSFLVRMCGELTCVNNEQLHIHIKSNGVKIIDGLVYTLSAANNKGWELTLDFTIAQIGGAGTAEILSNCLFTYNKNANNNIDGVHLRQRENSYFDTTINNNLVITAEWIGSSYVNRIKSQNFTLTKVF